MTVMKSIQKSFYLSLILLFSLSELFARVAHDWGKCGVGDNLWFTYYSNGDMVISGAGELKEGDVFNDFHIINLVLEDGVRKIGKGNFQDIATLQTVVTGTGLADIGADAFKGCVSLASVTFWAANPPTFYSGVFDGVDPSGLTFHVPLPSLSVYTDYCNKRKEVKNINIVGETEIPVSSVSLSVDTLEIMVGRQHGFSYSYLPSNATNPSGAFRVFGGNILSINGGGTISAIAPGTSIVTLDVPGTNISSSCFVTVRAVGYMSYLKKLTVDGTVCFENYAISSHSITYHVPYSKSTLNAVTVDIHEEAKSYSVSRTFPMELVVGDNIFTVTVTGNDNISTGVYTVNIIRDGLSASGLTGITVNGVPVPNLNDNSNMYVVTGIPYSVSSVQVNPFAGGGASCTVSPASPVSLIPGNNSVTVTVTLPDGTVKKYMLMIIRTQPLSNTKLDYVRINNTDIPGFSSYVSGYTYEVPFLTERVTVLAGQTDAGATYAVTPASPVSLNLGDNSVTVTVTAEDGTTKGNYTVNVRRLGANTDNTLSSILLNNVSVRNFSPSVSVYRDTVPYTVDTVDVTAETSNVYASYSVSPESPSALTAGVDNTVNITVTAQDGSTKVYTIHIFRRDLNADNNLTGIYIDGNILGDFEAGKLSYRYDVPYSKESVILSASQSDPLASVTGVPSSATSLNTGSNIFNIAVTAQNGSTKTYSVNIVRDAGADNLLESISIDGVPLEGFDPLVTSYSKDVEYDVHEVTVSPVTKNPNAVWAVNPPSQTNRVQLNIAGGVNVITVRVTAQNGAAKDYILNINRGASYIATLSEIKVDGAPIRNFSPSKYDGYECIVSYKKNEVTVSAVTTDTGASYAVSPESPVDVSSGSADVTVTVTAQDGTAKQDYTLSISKEAAPSINSLDSIIVDGEMIAGFASGTESYSINVPYSKTSVTIRAVTVDENAVCVISPETGTLNPGNNYFTFRVTAADGSVKDYHVLIKRDKGDNPNLKSLSIDGTPISGFNPNGQIYPINDVPFETNSLEITFETEDPYASASVSPSSPVSLIAGATTEITVMVTSPNGTEKVYTIKVKRKSGNNTDLKRIAVGQQTYHNEDGIYTVTVPYTQDAVNVSAETSDAGATYTVSPSSPVSLAVDTNIVIITVTARDNMTVREYTLKIIRKRSDDTSIKQILIDGSIEVPASSVDVSYYCTVENEVSSISVDVILNHSGASCQIDPSSAVALEEGFNLIEITVTADDGSTQKKYTLTVFRKAKLEEVLLDSIRVNGISIPDFNSAESYHTYTVDYETKTAFIEGMAQDAFEVRITPSENMDLNTGNNNITLSVKAKDGRESIYTLVITRLLSDDASLKRISIGGSPIPGFSPEKTEYDYYCSYNTPILYFDGEASIPESTVYTSCESPLILTGYQTVIEFRVVSALATEKTYRINVLYGSPADADLNFISINGVHIPDFSPDVLDYTCTVGSNVSSAVILKGKVNETSICTVSPSSSPLSLSTGDNPVSFTVNAQNGLSKTYTVNIKRQPYDVNTDLVNIRINGDLIPAFSADKTEYEYDVPNEAECVTVTPIPQNITSTYTVSPSNPVYLNVGDNNAVITVTSASGNSRTYTVNIRRAAASVALRSLQSAEPVSTDLSSISVNGVPIPNFNPANTEYTCYVNPWFREINITWEVSDERVAGSFIDYNMPADFSGIDEKTFTIMIYEQAFGGPAPKKYSVTVIREKTEAYTGLSSLKVNGTPVEGFRSDSTVYDLHFPNSIRQILIDCTPVNPRASWNVPSGNPALFDSPTSLNYQISVRVAILNSDIPGDVPSDVTAEAYYTLNITREEPKSNTNLSSIRVNGMEVPNFSPQKTEYEVTIPAHLENIVITGTPQDADATFYCSFSGNTFIGDSKTVTAMCIAEDGSRKEYSLTLKKEIVRLSSVFVNGKQMSVSQFSPGNTVTGVYVDYEISSVALTVITEDPTASCTFSPSGAVSLNSGETKTVNVTVTSASGLSSLVYVFNIKRSKSYDTSLSGIVVGGIPLPTFEAGTVSFTYSVPYAVSSLTVAGITGNADASCTVTPASPVALQVGSNLVIVKVTSQGGTEMDYKLDLVRGTPDENTDVTRLEVNGVHVDFKTATATFEYTVPWSVQTVGTVAVSLSSPVASYSVDRLPSSVLNVGLNSIIITVTAQSGVTRLYTLNITREPNTVNTLSGIYVEGVAIEGFSPSTTYYTVTFPFSKTSLSALTVTKGHSTVTYEIDRTFPLTLLQGPNVITVKAVSQSGLENEYVITVFRTPGSSDNTLASVAINGTKHTLSSETKQLALSVPYETTAITSFTAAVNHSGAMYVIDKTLPVTLTSANIGLSGAVDIKITVIAQNGDPVDYTVSVYRQEPSSDATLSGIRLGTADIADFNPETQVYTHTVGYPVSTLAVSATVTHQGAHYTVTPASPVSLTVGNNTVVIEVTAQDGISKKTYTVTAVREEVSSIATLSAIRVGTHSISAFSPETDTYRDTVANTTSSVAVSATVTHQGAHYTVTPASPVSLTVGNNPVEINVTAEDGTSTKKYTVNIVRDIVRHTAELSGITVNGEEIDNFSTAVLTYTVHVPNATVIAAVRGTGTDPDATVTVTGPAALEVGSNRYEVSVVSDDGQKTKKYNVYVVRRSSVSTFSAIMVASIPVEGFDPAVTEYTVKVKNSVSSVSVLATRSDANSSVLGSNPKTHRLNVGDNVIEIKCIAEDTLFTSTYTLIVRRLSNDAALQSVTVNGSTLAGSDTTVASAVTKANIQGKAAHAGAAVTGNGEFNLKFGLNSFVLTVTAEDTTVKRTYTVTVTRQAPSGSCGADAVWELRDSVLTISGSGKMTEFSGVTLLPWYQYLSDVKRVVVNPGIENIANYSFYYFKNTVSVTLPQSIESIGAYAFSGNCSLIDSLVIPQNVVSIGSFAFSGCNGLKALVNLNPVPQDINGKSVFPTTLDNRLRLYVPYGTGNDYRAAAVWKNFLVIELEGGTTDIRDVAACGVKVLSRGGIINVTSLFSETVMVYDITGKMLHNVYKKEGSIELNVGNVDGVVIVRGSSGWVYKLFSGK
jgi:tRNA threonylcarbamoyladenosine modification (KEOPS) complex  Pcc1 subunit